MPYGTSPFKTTLKIPNWSARMRFVSFITGLKIYLAPNTKTYDVSVEEVSESPYHLTFSVTVGGNNFLN